MPESKKECYYMIFKDLLDICSAENVVDEIQKQFSKAPSDQQLLLQQVNQLIQKMQTIEDFLILEDKLFCFMAVPKDSKEQSVYVSLYDIDKEDIAGGWENYKINKVRDWGWLDFQALGVTVFEPSLKKYGVDCIVAGVLGFILFGD